MSKAENWQAARLSVHRLKKSSEESLSNYANMVTVLWQTACKIHGTRYVKLLEYDCSDVEMEKTYVNQQYFGARRKLGCGRNPSQNDCPASVVFGF